MTLFSQFDEPLRKAFESISQENRSVYIKEISALIGKNMLDKFQLEELLKAHHIYDIRDIKTEILDMLLSYINFILVDDVISENEEKSIILLKRLFKIKEGDFFNFRYKEIETILDKQFQILYSDNQIDKEEALHKVGLQSLFDLGYDQFLQLVDKEVRMAIERGANPEELDTVFIKSYKK